MAQQNSFDIVSQVDSNEIANALNQTLKEVRQRFDFKGSAANVVHEKNELVLSAEDETKLRNMNDILQQKLVRRGVPLKAFSYGNVGPAAGGTVRQRAQIQEGIPQDKAKEVVKFIKDTKVKVQAAIQGDVVRVSGRDRDTVSHDVDLPDAAAGADFRAGGPGRLRQRLVEDRTIDDGSTDPLVIDDE